jgi:hypothetical protein
LLLDVLGDSIEVVERLRLDLNAKSHAFSSAPPGLVDASANGGERLHTIQAVEQLLVTFGVLHD